MGRREVGKVAIKSIEEYGASGISITEMCRILQMSTKTFYTHKKTKIWQEAFDRGRAQGAAACGKMVLAIAGARDLNACLNYLKRHSEGWKEQPQQLELKHEGSVVVKSDLSQPALDRIFDAYAKVRRPES